MDLLSQLLALDWLNISGWGAAIATWAFILRRFTAKKSPWLTWQQHTILRDSERIRGDEHKAASDKKDAVIENQAAALADNAVTLKVVDEFLEKVPIRRPPARDTRRAAKPQAETGA